MSVIQPVEFVKTDRFNRATRAAYAEAERTKLAALEAAYERIIRHAGNEAAKTLAAQQRTMTAAGWVPPPEGVLLPLAALGEYAVRQLRSLHRRIVELIVGQPLARVGISFDIAHPLNEALLAASARRTGVALGEAVQPELARIIQGAFADGLSVKDTATLIRSTIGEHAPGQAQMLARTDLNSLANGGSVNAAQLAGMQFKQWVTAHDEKVRETHREADGQVVPVDQPFLVGGELAQYPADPELSDEEAANCRCTVIYVDAPAQTASAAAAPVMINVPRPEVHMQATQTLAPELVPLLERSIAAIEETSAGLQRALTEMAALLTEISRERERRVDVFRDSRTQLIDHMIVRDE